MENTAPDALNVMKKSKTNFFYSSVFLSKKKQEGLRIIYAFCRKSDDIVDDESLTTQEKKEKLDLWEKEFREALNGTSKDDFLCQVAGKIKEFGIPEKPFFDLLRGMRMDITRIRYNNFDELYEYCYCVASSVGLMCIKIFDCLNPGIEAYAVNLGVALQLTNILRDVKKDAAVGRIYLPGEDLQKFGYSEDNILASVYNDNFIELMKFQSERTKEYYKKADSFLSVLSFKERGYIMPARIIKHIYFNLLKNIEKTGYNVFGKVISVSKVKKFLIAFAVFIKYKLLYKTI